MPTTSWRDARRIASSAASALSPSDVPLAAALGRVLATPVRARTDLPGFDTAAMDGYAVTGDGPWQVVGRVLAGGAAWGSPLAPGQAVEIMTGAVVPVGAEAVLPYETADLSGGRGDGRPHIRRAGEDARAGDPLVEAGRVVTPAVAGLLAQAGVDAVAVHRQPRVRLVVTGDEVVGSGVPGPGQVRDVFGPTVTGLVAAAGGVVVEHVLLRDDPGLLAECLGAPGAEVVVVTGSSSAGAADHLHGALNRVGARRLVDRVACRPGGPQLLAALPGLPGRTQETAGLPDLPGPERGSRGALDPGDAVQFVVGLPGNPFAGLVAAFTVLEPLLHGLAGRAFPAPLLRLPVHGDVVVTAPVTRLVPVRLAGDHAVVVPGSRPASLAGAAAADALAVLEDGWADGAPADLLPLA